VGEEAGPVSVADQRAQQQREREAREAQALIDRHIAVDPDGRGPADAYLKDYGTSVWALVAYLQGGAAGDARRAAADYEVPLEAVRAALAYYARHKAHIDARLLLNSAA
jgi:uncharacterized protein (DUF433 family)